MNDDMADQAAELEARWEVNEVDAAMALRRIPEVYGQPDPATLARLPKGGAQLDYMGHADVTLALIAVDPYWDWAPAGTNPDGTPVIITSIGRDGAKLKVMWGTLTVLGQTRRCVGTAEGTKGDVEKELIGDLIRNGAMRFGIATKLWSKAERENLARPAAKQAAAPRQPAAPRDDAPPREAADDAPKQDDSPLAKENRHMRVLLKHLGGVDRETMLEIAGSVVGRTIGSSKELTLDEVRAFNARLQGIERKTHVLVATGGKLTITEVGE